MVTIHQEHRNLWRTRVGQDEVALVEPLMVALKDGAVPVRCKPRRYPSAQLQFLEDHVALLVQYGFVKKNNLSRWASNAVPVRKSDNPSDFRVMNDYTKVNEKTIPIAGTMPLFAVILSFVAGAKYFSKFDMFKGFWQILFDPRCRELFSFMTHDGVYTPLLFHKERRTRYCTSRTRCRASTSRSCTKGLLSGSTTSSSTVRRPRSSRQTSVSSTRSRRSSASSSTTRSVSCYASSDVMRARD